MFDPWLPQIATAHCKRCGDIMEVLNVNTTNWTCSECLKKVAPRNWGDVHFFDDDDFIDDKKRDNE